MSVEEYISGVQDGTILVSKTIRQAVQRHLDDLKRKKFKYEYVPEIAEKYINFIELFRLTDQDMAEDGNLPKFKLLPYHKYMVAMIHGWRVREDHTLRRFTDVYFQVARKNAKSMIIAALIVAHFYLDKKSRAQFYTAAMSREQAGEVFEMAKSIIEKLCEEYPRIAARTKILDQRIVDMTTQSFIGKLSKQANTIEGKGMYVGSLDEYHIHPKDDIVSSMKKGSVKHKSPIMYRLTTPGDDMAKPCYAHYEYCKKIVEGIVENDRLYVQIHELDDESEVHNKAMWIKPNPGMGHTCMLESIDSEYQEAQDKGGQKMADFKTKHLGMWVGSATEWIRSENIKACMIPMEWRTEIVDKLLFGGVDIAYSDVGDICAASFYWEVDEKTGKAFTIYWIPEGKANSRSAEMDYVAAAERKHIIITPGDMTDYGQVLRDLLEIQAITKIKTIYFDPWNISYFFGVMVDAGLPVEKFSQSDGNMSPPAKRIGEMINTRELAIHDNPITRWMFSNVLIKDKGNGIIKIMRIDRKRKIDGVISLVIAYAAYINDKINNKKYTPTIISLN